jgi:hypothetical protein
VVLAGAVSFQKEIEDSECKEPPCAAEQNMIVPEPSHAPEEVPEYKIDADEVWLMNTSPMVTAKRGSKEHLGSHLTSHGSLKLLRPEDAQR